MPGPLSPTISRLDTKRKSSHPTQESGFGDGLFGLQHRSAAASIGTSSVWHTGESLQAGFDEEERVAMMLCDSEASHAWIASMFDRFLTFYNEQKKNHTPRHD